MKTLALALLLFAAHVVLAEAKPAEKTLCVSDNDARTVCAAKVEAQIGRLKTWQAQQAPRRHFQRAVVAARPVAAVEEAQPFGAFESSIVTTARRYVGRNPGGWKHPRQWCMEFVNKVLHENGRASSRSARAIDGLQIGQRVSQPQSGDLVVYRHHVGIFVKWQGRTPVIISGNFNRVVAEAPHRGRPVAFIRPS